MREPMVAGQFYPAGKEELNETIKQCFLHKLGKRRLPKGEEKYEKSKKINKVNKIKAVISPHAGYTFSGPCMSHVFYELSTVKTPDTYIIIGLSHYGHSTCLSDQDFKTPLGILENNSMLTTKISKKCNIPINNSSHSQEHSLEVLLPFLQFVKPDQEIKIVPLIIGQESLDEIKKIGKLLKETIKDYAKEIIILVSSDFTHHGPNYGYMPSKDIKEMDMKAINLIKEAKTEELYNYHQETGITICGIYPIMMLLESIDFKKSELLCYYKSTEIMKFDENNSVSYAGIIFK